jgi:hypothetical protein
MCWQQLIPLRQRLEVIQVSLIGKQNRSRDTRLLGERLCPLQMSFYWTEVYGKV